MGRTRKVAISTTSPRKYNAAWEDKYKRREKSTDSSEDGWCKPRKKLLRPKLSTFADHEKYAQHKGQIYCTPINQVQPMEQFSKRARIDNSVKEAELQLAACMACSCTISTIDHFSAVVSAHGKRSSSADLQLHRTKCSALITKVIAPAIKEDLKKDISGCKYSLLIDELTDVSFDKLLVILIRYYSPSQKKLVTALVSVINIVQATGEAIYHAIKESVESINVKLLDCIGLSCDGASAYIGEHNSVWSRLKQDSPFAVRFKCTYHSLQLCVQAAFEIVPASIGYLMSKIPAWFNKSTLRRESYKELFRAMTMDDETVQSTISFAKYAKTRWLCRNTVLKNILNYWDELKLYFQMARKESGQEGRFEARMIADILCNQETKLYFLFLNPIVAEFERVSAAFQADYCHPEKLYDLLYQLYQGIHVRVYDQNGNHLPNSKVIFGVSFNSECNTLLKKLKSEAKEFSSSQIDSVKVRCRDFFLKLLNELKKRIHSPKNIFYGLSHLAPKKVLSQVNRANFGKLPFPNLQSDQDAIETQYLKILFVDWKSQSGFDGEVPHDVVQFWHKVSLYTDAAGNKEFKDLADYALACLSVPVSNATVERLFSMVSLTKTKTRNRMKPVLLESILRIRSHLHFAQKCCVDFVCTKEMLARFCSREIYSSPEETEELMVYIESMQ